jgi:hypothetical protein
MRGVDSVVEIPEEELLLGSYESSSSEEERAS